MGSDSASNALKVLFAPDIKHSNDFLGLLWIEAVIRDLSQSGCDVSLILRDFDGSEARKILHKTPVRIIDALDFGEDSRDESGVIPRFHARQVVRELSKTNFDAVLVQGLELASFVSGSGRASHNLWCVVDSSPLFPRLFELDELTRLEKTATQAKLILTCNPEVRSQIDNRCVAATSKTRLFPQLKLRIPSRLSRAENEPEGHFCMDFSNFEAAYLQTDFSELVQAAKEVFAPPRLLVYGISKDEFSKRAKNTKAIDLQEYPGLTFINSEFFNGRNSSTTDKLIIPQWIDVSCAANVFRLFEEQGGSVKKISGTPTLAELEDDSSTDFKLAKSPQPDPHGNEPQITSRFKADLPDYSSVPLQASPRNLLLVGADFKFAGDIVDFSTQRSDLNVKADILASNGRVNEAQSMPLLNWADIILIEFASQNAVWYSKNVQPHQKLIVHLHGYELYSDWISELRIENTHAVVVASEFYKEKVIDKLGWPSSKVVSIPNSVRPEDLNRCKDSEARFHIGIVGIVPILKRPDRAIDLLEKLLETDERYTLHIRGHSPWNYPWEWQKPAHQDAYRDFYRRIAEDPKLRARVSFEEFGPDIGNWLQKIGWILSPSYRETFHLAAIEGACSGAIPIAWRREGSDEIIGKQYNFDSTEDALNFILSTNRSEQSFYSASADAKQSVKRYSTDFVRTLWLNLFFDDFEVTTAEVSDPGLSREENALYCNVLEELTHRDIEGALSLLNDGIKLTVGKHGRLKELELYVRGIAALDDTRFDFFQPQTGVKNAAPAERVLTVVPEDRPNRFFEINGLHRNSIAIAPPTPIRQPSLHEELMAPAILKLSPTGEYRYDRWVQYCKAAIIKEAIENGSDSIFASGDWWTALPAALAADQLNLRFDWFLNEAQTVELKTTRTLKPSSSDLVAQIQRAVAMRADHLFTVDGMNITEWKFLVGELNNAPEESIDGEASILDLEQIAKNCHSQKSTHEYQQQRLDACNIEISLLGFDSKLSLGGLSKATLNYIDSIEQIPEHCDLLLINGNHLGEGKNHSTELAKEAIRLARLKSIRSCFIYEKNKALSPSMLDLARTCDSVSTRWLPPLAGLLELNPLQLTTLTTWAEKLTDEENLILALKANNVPILADIELKFDSTQLSSANFDHEQIVVEDRDLPLPLSRESDGVTIVIATHKGVQRIGRVLFDISRQTLPAHLIEVIVVENGFSDGTELVVQKFAEDNPLVSCSYYYSDLPSAGNARNIGLDHLTSKFVTFIDDDDRLEPNYLLAMWLSAAEDAIVVGGLTDQFLDGSLNANTPNNARLAALRESRVPLALRSGLLFMNSCKLIPSERVRKLRYDINLKSGEDVVFMSALLEFEDLNFVPAANIASADYIRVLREDSISRKSPDFDFAIVQRVAVLNRLTTLLDRLPKSAQRPIEVTQHAQASFIRRFREENPDQEPKVLKYLEENLLPLRNNAKLK